MPPCAYFVFDSLLPDLVINATVAHGNFSETFVFAAGDVGIEYNFPTAPILFSLDLRPEFGFGNNFNDYGSDIALSVRYQF